MSDTTEHQVHLNPRSVIPVDAAGRRFDNSEHMEDATNYSLRAKIQSQSLDRPAHSDVENLRGAVREIVAAAVPDADLVNHPPHYTGGSIECIDAIEASMSRIEFQGFLKGQVIKYQWRYRQKGGVEDLKKAQWYLAKHIATFDGPPTMK